MKKIKWYLIGLIIALLIEVFPFNVSFWSSLGNDPVDCTVEGLFETGDDGVHFRIEGLDLEVTNIHFIADVSENSPVSYYISLTDEGNYYDYYLPEGNIASTVPSSFFSSIHAYGKVHSLDIEFQNAESAALAPFEIKGIVLNDHRPLFFNFGRFLIIYLVFVFLYALRSNGKLAALKMNFDKASLQGRRQLVITLGCITLMVVMMFFITSSHLLFNEASKPHHQQYKELAVALESGQTALSYEASEGILQSPNPYDTIYLQANNIEYNADYSYYNGRYYVYFGLVPELLLYLPFHLVTGKDFPNWAAVFVFSSLFAAGTFLMFREIIRNYFTNNEDKESNVTFVSYILVSLFTVLSGTFAYVYFTADLYSVPIMAGLAFTVWGIFFWLWSTDSKQGKKSRMVLFTVLGSLCMAFVAGCRPQMVLFSVMAIPLFFGKGFKQRELLTKDSVGRTVGFVLPYVLVAIVLMHYNYVRFESVFDFGATYSLTNNDMNLRGASPSRMLLGMGTFLFSPPYYNGVFPFLHTAELRYSYMGRMVTEHFLGGVIACNVLSWVLLLLPHYAGELKRRRLGLFAALLLAVSLIIGLLDANQAGVLQRYTADFAFGIIVVSSIVLIMLVKEAPRLGLNFLKIGFLLETGYAFLVICNDASGITLKLYNPELFYKIASMFSF